MNITIGFLVEVADQSLKVSSQVAHLLWRDENKLGSVIVYCLMRSMMAVDFNLACRMENCPRQDLQPGQMRHNRPSAMHPRLLLRSLLAFLDQFDIRPLG